MQQFSFHVGNEGTVLLDRIKALSPEWYDCLFRSLDLETAVRPPGVQLGDRRTPPGPLPAPTPTSAGAAVAGLNTEVWLQELRPQPADRRWCLPDYRTKAQLQLPSYQVATDVFTYLGWNGVPGGSGQHIAGTRSIELGARWAVAARHVPELWQAQVELSLNRFTRLQNLTPFAGGLTFPDPRPTDVAAGGGGQWTVSLPTLCFSDAVAAGVYDLFINQPDVAPAVRRALLRTRASLAAEVRPFTLRSDLFRMFYLLHLLDERRYLSDAREAVNNVVDARNGQLLRRVEEWSPNPAQDSQMKLYGPRSLSPFRGFTW
jgi:hypothetical protein